MLSCIFAAGFSDSMMMAIVSTAGVISISVISLFWQTFKRIVFASRRKRLMKDMIVFMINAIPLMNIIVVLFIASRETLEADLQSVEEADIRLVVIGCGICATFGYILGSIGLSDTHLRAASTSHLFLGGVAAAITSIRCEREKMLFNLFVTTVFIPHVLGVLFGRWKARSSTNTTPYTAFMPMPVSPPCAPPGEDTPDETKSLTTNLPQQPFTRSFCSLPSQPGVMHYWVPVTKSNQCAQSFKAIAESKAQQHKLCTTRPGTDDTDDSLTSLASQDSYSAQTVKRLMRNHVPDVTTSYPVLDSSVNGFLMPPVDTAMCLADSVFCNEKLLERMASKGIERITSDWCTRQGDKVDSIMVFLATHIYKGDFSKVKDLTHSHTLFWGLYAIPSNKRGAFLVAAAIADLRTTACQRVVLKLNLVSTHVDWRRVGIADTLIIRLLPELISDGWIYAESNSDPFWESSSLVVAPEAISVYNQLNCDINIQKVPRIYRVSKNTNAAADALVRCLEEEDLVDVLMGDADSEPVHRNVNEVPHGRVALDFNVCGNNASRILTFLYNDSTRNFTTVDGCYYASLDEGMNGGSAIGLYENAETVIRSRHPFETVKLRAIRS
jgi:hypothetical protein